jgi:hypothetical protein
MSDSTLVAAANSLRVDLKAESSRDAEMAGKAAGGVVIAAAS